MTSSGYLQNMKYWPCINSNYSKHAKRRYVNKNSEWKDYSGLSSNARSYLAAYFQNNSSYTYSKEKVKAIHLVAEIANLKKNWNDNEADPIPVNILLKAFELIEILTVLPDIFPTACGTIQFEYEKATGEYLELELQEDGIKVFKIDSANVENTELISYEDFERLKQIVEKFNE